MQKSCISQVQGKLTKNASKNKQILPTKLRILTKVKRFSRKITLIIKIVLPERNGHCYIRSREQGREETEPPRDRKPSSAHNPTNRYQ